MKKKNFTKSDRLWLFTLLKLIKNTAKIRKDAAGKRCPKPEKSKKSSDTIDVDIMPQLANLFLPTNAMNDINLEDYPKGIDNLENVICKKINNSNKKRVSFTDNNNGCGDTCSEKLCGSHSILKKNNRDIEKDIFEDIRNLSSCSSNSCNGGRMASSDYQSLMTLANRLDNIKKDSRNRGLPGSVNVGDKDVTKPLNAERRQMKPHYELTKDSVRNIPFGFLTEIKDAVPGGVDKLIEKHTRRKASKSAPDHFKKKQISGNSTRLSSKKIIDNFGKGSGNSPKAPSQAENIVQKSINNRDKTNSGAKQVTTNYRDVSSSFGEKYKRITMALEAKKITPGKGELNGATGELNIDDSLEDLQSLIQGTKHLISADVDKKRTKVLKSKYYLERTNLPKTNREVSNQFKSVKKSKDDNVEQEGKSNSVNKKKPTEDKDRVKQCGYECYLTRFFKHREAYLDRFGLKGV